MFTRTFSSLADDARALTDRAKDPSLENEQLAPWINQEARRLWVLAAQMGADEFTKVSAQFSVTAGNTFTIATVGGADAATDFMHLRGVDVTYDGGAHFVRVRPWRFIERDRLDVLRYRLLGRVLHLLPAEFAKTRPLRYWYVFKPPEMLASGDPVLQPDTIDLPVGGDDFIAAGVAAKIRVRYEEDPIIHLAAQRAAGDTMQRWFAMNRQGEGEPVREADADDGEIWWGW